MISSRRSWPVEQGWREEKEPDRAVDAHPAGEAPVPGQFRRRWERKFFVVPRNIGLAYALLRHVCRPDSEYPSGQINSLYFDTPDLDQHQRSADGDLNKDKVRIRWYGDDGTLAPLVPVFLEHKSRHGFASSKRRERFPVPADNLRLNRLPAGIVEKTTLLDTLAGFGHFPGQPLRPVILISYWRYRFTEVLTGVRVSLDHDIRSTLVARELGWGERDLRLHGGVIEVKGLSPDLPRTLRRVMELVDTDWSRFSKYGYCIDSHLAGLGSTGRLWPSGRMAEP
jgi:hypothetical protein